MVVPVPGEPGAVPGGVPGGWANPAQTTACRHTVQSPMAHSPGIANQGGTIGLVGPSRIPQFQSMKVWSFVRYPVGWRVAEDRPF